MKKRVLSMFMALALCLTLLCTRGQIATFLWRAMAE